jgi:carboxyl-terminal processing protease
VRRRRHPLADLALVGLFAIAEAATAAPPTTPAQDADREAVNLATFDRAWSLVADTHWDPDLGGVDWQAVRDELRPRAGAARSDRELRRVLEEMVGKLGQSHFALLPSGAEDDAPSGAENGARSHGEDSGDDDLLPQCAPKTRAEILAALDRRDPEDGEAGLELRMLDRYQIVVTRLVAGGPAAAAGVATGWRLLAVDGRALDRQLSCFDAIGNASFHRQLVGAWLRALLQGPSGTESRLRFETGRGREQEVVVWREPAPGERVRFGNLPAAALRFEVTPAETRRRAQVAVVRFNLWLLPVATAFEQAMPELRRADAVVVDLRGNPGGVSAIAQGVAGHFVAETLSLGSMKGRRDDLELVVQPRRVARDGSRVEPYAGPLAILIDEGSASTSELFAAGLRDHDRARLFGARSAGAALPAVMDKLPNGDVFMHASMDYVRPNGERVEGRPIVPDVETPLRRADLRAGKDAALDAALAWIDAERRRGSARPQTQRSKASP